MKIYNNVQYQTIKTKDLQFHFLRSGDLFQIQHQNDQISMYRNSEIEGSVANLYLRIEDHGQFSFTKLMGVDSPSTFALQQNQAFYKGQFEGIKYLVTLTILDDKWYYDIDFSSQKDIKADLFYGQDVSLNSDRANEAYVSQYLDHKVLEDQNGYHILTRQNQGFPYLLEQGCLSKSVSYSTDGFQFFGLDYKFDQTPKAMKDGVLENKNYQYEFAYIALQHSIQWNDHHAHVTFYGYLNCENQGYPDQILDMDEIIKTHDSIQFSVPTEEAFHQVERTINMHHVYTSSPFTKEEVDTFFPNRNLEEKIDNKLVSFFLEDSEHVVLQEKERYVERPHGSIIMQDGFQKIEESPLSTTNYIFGVFNSHVVIGNTNLHKLDSDLKNPLNVCKGSGERLFVKIHGEYQLLGLPAAYVMSVGSATWYYKIGNDILLVEVAMRHDAPLMKLKVTSLNKQPYDLILVDHLVMGENDYAHQVMVEEQAGTYYFTADKNNYLSSKYPGLTYQVRFNADNYQVGNDSIFFTSHISQYPVVTCSFKQVSTFEKVLIGSLQGKVSFKDDKDIKQIKIDYDAYFKANLHHFHVQLEDQELANKLNHTFVWFAHNALIHYAAPHGLEQYGGGAWGTRDVCQGPVELFIALDRYDLVRDIILKIYSKQFIQNGDWPQWCMFDRYVNIHASDSHGDIILWPLHALAMYLHATNDISILQEVVPYLDLQTHEYSKESTTIENHVKKQLKAIVDSFIPNTHLSRYGGGDWDDTLQPFDREMPSRSVSGWTIALTIETLESYARAMTWNPKEAKELAELVNNIKKDYNLYVICDDVPAGFVYFQDPISYILHPRDNKTKIAYRLLPFNQGISAGLFSKEQIEKYLTIIDQHLKHPDGVRLMSDAVNYQGGKHTFFMRAETATNFGREIGLQYVHAHIRYIEAMSKINQSERVLEGLLTVNPMKIQEYVKNALPRQANMYFSSSDGYFYDRYEAKKNFDMLRSGQVKVKGGWRLYSSGAGIYLYQIIDNVLGLKRLGNDLMIDPCISKKLHNLSLTYTFEKKVIHIHYQVTKENGSVTQVVLNGKEVTKKIDTHSYKGSSYIIDSALLERENTIFIMIS